MNTSKISTGFAGNNNANANNVSSLCHVGIYRLFFLFSKVKLKIKEAAYAKMCYTIRMQKHWSVDEKGLSKDPGLYAIWKLEQRINFGIGEPMMNRAELFRYFEKLDIDPFKRKALALALKP